MISGWALWKLLRNYARLFYDRLVKSFHVTTFALAFTTVLAIALLLTLGRTINRPQFDFREAALDVIGSVLIAILLGYVAGSFRIGLRMLRTIYRSIMRKLAKKALRASLSVAMTRLVCLGILERNGGVALSVRIDATEEDGIDLILNVYDSVNDRLWGRVTLVEVQTSSCIYEDLDRINIDFWEHLEDRMTHDTSPPNVYLVRALPTNVLDLVERLLDNWR